MLIDPPELSTETLIGPGRVALVVEYDGQGFHGWQAQKGSVRSVQGLLAKAVARVADHPVDLVCAGRTDAGVHASFQVVHFDTTSRRSLRSWILGINSALPGDIRVHWVGAVASDFSARFSATARRYRYLIHNSGTPPAILRGQVTWSHRWLDAERMNQAAQALVGEHDFSAFRAAGCQANRPWRCVHRIQVERFGHLVVVDVAANAFLHHMVRNITGSLMSVGQGDQPVGWVADTLACRDRRLAGVTAPAQGLYLIDIEYPRDLMIPRPRLGPPLMQFWHNE